MLGVADYLEAVQVFRPVDTVPPTSGRTVQEFSSGRMQGLPVFSLSLCYDLLCQIQHHSDASLCLY